MPSPLEDRVRELCIQVIAAQNEAALDQVLPQLQAAIKEFVHDTRIRAVEVIPRTFRSNQKAA
jgi:hypothetical protein